MGFAKNKKDDDENVLEGGNDKNVATERSVRFDSSDDMTLKTGNLSEGVKKKKKKNESGIPISEEIAQLRDEITETTIDLSAEKAMKKKKDRHLFKLASQLKLKMEELKEKEETIRNLYLIKNKHDSKTASLKSSLSNLRKYHQKMLREHQEEINEQLSKYRKLCSDVDTRIAEISGTHEKESEVFRRQILKINMEADQLRAQLSQVEVLGGLRYDFINLRKGFFVDRIFLMKLFLFFLSLFLLITNLFRPGITKALLCSPAIPDTTMISAASTYGDETPWWATNFFKEALRMLCTSEQNSKGDFSSATWKLLVKEVIKAPWA